VSYQETIAEVISAALTGPLGIAADQVDDLSGLVEVPKDTKMGDFAFPCFRLARVMRKKPNLIAEDLLPHLEAAVAENADLAEVAAVGPYLNFRVNKAALAASLIPSVLAGEFLAARPAKGEKVMIEYSQPNTHKAFHVGHTRNVALGDALVRIFEWDGFEVVAANYIGDEGTHIAKCLWYYRNHFDGEVPDHNLGEFLGDLYTAATDLLDFSLLTRCPMRKVSVARVDAIADHPQNEKLKVVSVLTAAGRLQVICGGTGYDVGDLVAYAHEGSRVNGRTVGTITKDGITSVGMILSEAELGLSDDKMQLYRFPPDTEIGTPVTEFFRLPNASIPDDVTVEEIMGDRERGVAETLRGLEAREPELYALFEKTKKWSMDEFHAIYDWLDARFDHYFFESEVGDRGKQKVLEAHEQGILVESEGAIGADLSEEKLPFFLLLKSNGSGLYSTKDIALAQDKFEKFGIDRSIYVVDVSQSLHFQQVFATLQKMGYEQAKLCHHLAYGIVMLPGPTKMGSRYGNVILFSSLSKQLMEKITEKHLEIYRGEWSDEEIERAAHVVAKATIKYGMTNHDNNKDLIFDMESWISASGNTGPYMLYAYARTRNILAKVGALSADPDWSLLNHETESGLLSTIAQFPEVVMKARAEYRPQLICLYLFDLSKDFSGFYNNCSVIKAESEPLKAARAQLVDSVGRVIQKGLSLLGIETLERM